MWIVRQRSLIQIYILQGSGGHPTPLGKAGRVRPCRLAEAAHRTPHGKRVAAAKRNEPFSHTYLIKGGLPGSSHSSKPA
ncbi:hypothetical protein [Rossellomorea marisflavi]|uniref:hypothetical protein n=1 Tax=Rossellomorea marisflavi TaxID=189381 RepID=UPI001364BA19|nr:hypothetical protein [Rossellomorea marisflavi]